MSDKRPHGGARVGSGRPVSTVPLKKPLGTSVDILAKEKLKSLADASGHSQAKILEHLLASCDSLPDELVKIRK